MRPGSESVPATSGTPASWSFLVILSVASNDARYVAPREPLATATFT